MYQFQSIQLQWKHQSISSCLSRWVEGGLEPMIRGWVLDRSLANYGTHGSVTVDSK